ncbi:MAG TPA: phosphoribosylamine--glycine ligase [Spirochaetales bacterium]|nr:phosphoribosylamine--glycine ligase [Spirochaetales bacterium]
MKILLIGSGGREHAIAEALSRSPAGGELVIAPGNPGTAALGRNVPVEAADVTAVAALAVAEAVDLVVVGPEAPLALGLADELAARGIACFGPSRAAAALESSKAFAKATMASLGVPTADYGVFADFDEAAAFVRSAPWPVVLKASGLASGKGVVLPGSADEAVGALHAMMRGGRLGDAAREVVIEERLEGEELSLMAFCDGSRLALMPGARDHKRLLDGDLGPNTGGMGAFAPACTPELAAEYARLTMEPVVESMRARGTPFVGVLYAGLIVAPSGPKVLEYNCRFGDPEAQAVLALFDGDLAATLAACAAGDLRKAPPSWKAGAAACVVMASDGYPERPIGGAVLSGLGPAADEPARARVLHANTRLEDGSVVSGGGRVLSVVATGADLPEAVAAAYAKVDGISFPGARFRRDIGARELSRLAAEKPRGGSAYASSGVDIDAGNEAVRRMSKAVRATYSDAVLGGIGSFGGLYDAAGIKAMSEPVLVASTDGVGTKVKLAALAGSYSSIGMDIVNHCVDDILVQGARPLLFLDYFASSRLDPAMVAEAVGGMAEACRAAGCALIGGETAEMPGVYRDGEFDVAGTILGVVERGSILPAAGVGPGDALVGFASSGPHTNGYSLARRAFDGVDLATVYPELGRPLGEVLLAPHRSYLPPLWPALSGRPGLVKALAHITGGGFVENLPRVLPDGVDAVVRRGSWPVPPLYGLIERLGGVGPDEMYRVFNMGIGMVAVVDRGRVDELRDLVGEECWVIGELVRSSPGEKARARLAGGRA